VQYIGVLVKPNIFIK